MDTKISIKTTETTVEIEVNKWMNDDEEREVSNRTGDIKADLKEIPGTKKVEISSGEFGTCIILNTKTSKALNSDYMYVVLVVIGIYFGFFNIKIKR